MIGAHHTSEAPLTRSVGGRGRGRRPGLVDRDGPAAATGTESDRDRDGLRLLPVSGSPVTVTADGDRDGLRLLVVRP